MARSLAGTMRSRRASERSRWRDGEAGFTLVEMLVVITIIGLVVGLVGPRVLTYLSELKVKAAKIQIESFSSALDLYYLDNGRYPGPNEGLDARSFKNRPTPRPGTAPISRPARFRPTLGDISMSTRFPANTRPMRSSPTARPDRRAAILRG